jgi:hypothetical protein
VVGAGCGFLGYSRSAGGVGVGLAIGEADPNGMGVIVADGEGTIVGEMAAEWASISSSLAPNIPTKTNPAATNGSVILRNINSLLVPNDLFIHIHDSDARHVGVSFGLHYARVTFAEIVLAFIRLCYYITSEKNAKCRS